MNRIKSGRTEHIIDISINYQTGKADEYRQEKIIEKDPVTGIESSYWNTLLTYDERYTVDLLNANLHYRLLWSNSRTRRSHSLRRRTRLFPIGRRSIQSSVFIAYSPTGNYHGGRIFIPAQKQPFIMDRSRSRISHFAIIGPVTQRSGPLNTPKVCFYQT